MPDYQGTLLHSEGYPRFWNERIFIQESSIISLALDILRLPELTLMSMILSYLAELTIFPSFIEVPPRVFKVKVTQDGHQLYLFSYLLCCPLCRVSIKKKKKKTKIPNFYYTSPLKV